MAERLLGYPLAFDLPERVRAFQTTRRGGVSAPPWDTLNLGTHVGDDPAAVAANRARVVEAAALPAAPVYLEQVHGTAVVDLGGVVQGKVPQADAAVAFEPGRVAVVLTADCLPVLFADRHGTRVAAAHGGWRGLTAGVLEATVAALDCPPASLLAWIGPGIGAAHYEVGPEVVAAVRERHPFAAAAVAETGDTSRLHLAQYAASVLAYLGVDTVTAADTCTAGEPALWFSYRRDGTTGRQGAFIWIEP